MNRIDKILEVWDALGQDASLADLAEAISRKFHIVNDNHLFYAVKCAMDANKHLFKKNASREAAHIDNELYRLVTFEKFQLAYSKVLEQADSNAKTLKSHGPKIPFGFDFASNKNVIDGGAFSQHFGQGAATKTPYISWHVVSVYYVVDKAKIILGIEKDRYKHIDEMTYIDEQAIGNKNSQVAIFYECPKDGIDYRELYDVFMSVSQRVMELGLT